MAIVANAAALDTATPSMFFDQNGQIVHVNVAIGAEPSDFDYSFQHYFAFSDKPGEGIEVAGFVAEPNLDKVPAYKVDDKGLLWGVTIPNRGNAVINNSEGDFDDFFQRLDWQGAQTILHIGGDDLPFANYLQYFDGWVVDDPKWTLQKVTWKLADKRERLKGEFTNSGINRTNYPGLDKKWDNKPLPFIYGNVQGVPVILLTRHYTLANDITKTQTTDIILVEDLDLDIPGVPGRKMFPNQGRIIIANEKIGYTGVNRPLNKLSGVTRGLGTTKTRAHSAGDEATLFRSDTANVEDGIKCRIANSIDPNAIQAVYKDGDTMNENNFSFRSFSDTFQLAVNDTGIGVGDESRLTVDVGGEVDGGSQITNYADVILNILDSMIGFDTTDDIDTSTFTSAALEAEGTVGIYIGAGAQIDDVLEMITAGALGRIYLTQDGKIAFRIWVPATTTGLDCLELDDGLRDYSVTFDSKRIYSQIKVKYNQRYDSRTNRDGEKWQEKISDNPLIDRIFPKTKAMTVETAETEDSQAQILADRLMLLHRTAQKVVELPLAGWDFSDKTTVDFLKLNLDRPPIDEEIYEIQAITLNPDGTFKLKLSDGNGLIGKVGVWTDDLANDYVNASADERAINGFWSDDDGKVDPTDDETKNIKLWW